MRGWVSPTHPVNWDGQESRKNGAILTKNGGECKRSSQNQQITSVGRKCVKSVKGQMIIVNGLG